MARITREDVEKLLNKVPEPFVFWCHDGRIFRNLSELGEALGNMSDDTFAYHSNDYKKDFANWVRDIIGDEKLARDLEKSSTRIAAAQAVNSRLSFLNKKLAS